MSGAAYRRRRRSRPIARHRRASSPVRRRHTSRRPASGAGRAPHSRSVASRFSVAQSRRSSAESTPPIVPISRRSAAPLLPHKNRAGPLASSARASPQDCRASESPARPGRGRSAAGRSADRCVRFRRSCAARRRKRRSSEGSTSRQAGRPRQRQRRIHHHVEGKPAPALVHRAIAGNGGRDGEGKRALGTLASWRNKSPRPQKDFTMAPDPSLTMSGEVAATGARDGAAAKILRVTVAPLFLARLSSNRPFQAAA